MSDEGWWGASLLAAADPRAVWARAGDAVPFGTLREETARLARILPAYGIGRGATVAVHGTPSFTQLWCVFALWSLGAQVILLEPALDRAERETLLALSAPQFVLTLRGRHDGEDVFEGECEVLVRRRRGGRPATTPHCLVQFSSGTTGRPKAAGRTAASLRTELARTATLAAMPRAGEQVAVLEPVAHSFALIGGVLHALAVGATVVFPGPPPTRRSPRRRPAPTWCWADRATTPRSPPPAPACPCCGSPSPAATPCPRRPPARSPGATAS
ncbi:AMP-binding protein [Streptomyces sp. ST1020]|uniref:AMP-binding protein n=1 Tax=Streptomyces sp. ST1020 TaxID=1848901 RepID=UPI0034C6772F